MKSKRSNVILTLILVIAIALGLWSYQKGLLKRWIDNTPSQIIHISCPNLTVACKFKIDDQNYSIQSAKPINTSEPVKLTLTGPAQSVRLNWQMANMEMGNNSYKMLSDDQNTWRAETMLPLCTQQRMDWLLTLDIDQTQVLIQTQSGKRN